MPASSQSSWPFFIISTSSLLLLITTTTTITALPTTTFTQIPFITNTTTTTTFQTPSQPLLNSHCLTTADCHNVTTFSRCYSGQCICSLGYQVVGGRSCIKVGCIFNSDCRQLFPSSACDPGSGRCVCDYFHSLHAPSQTCSEVNALDWAIFLVFAAFLFGSVAFIVGVFFKVTLVDGVLELVSLKKRSGYSGIN